MKGKYKLVKKFMSYGHYELTITDNAGKSKSMVTDNTDLITRLSSEFEKEREEATDEAIALVLASK